MTTSPAERMRTFPYESCVGVKPIVVGWCPICEVVEDPYVGPGVRCAGDHDFGSIDSGMMHRRRMWKCPGIADGICDFYFLTYRGLLEHEHGFV